MGYLHPDYFADVDNKDDFYLNSISCNSVSVTMTTSALINQMVSRGKGLIINIASLAGAGPMPLLSVYAATKVGSSSMIDLKSC